MFLQMHLSNILLFKYTHAFTRKILRGTSQWRTKRFWNDSGYSAKNVNMARLIKIILGNCNYDYILFLN